MSRSKAAIIALLASVAAASPAATANFCAVVTKAVTLAHAQAPASAFCSSYLHIPVSTSTVTTTPSTTITTEATATVTPDKATETETQTEINTPTETQTDTSITGTVTSTSRGDTCPTPGSKAKRDSKPKPACFSSYKPGAALSSACSCLHVPMSTTTITKAAPTSTATQTTTTTTTLAQETTTTTITTTVDGPATTTTETALVDATTTTFVLNPPPCQTDVQQGRAGLYDNQGDLTYKNYYSGCNVRDNPRNFGDVFTRNYPGSDSVCTAVDKCALEGAQQRDELQFDLHRVIATGEWECRIFRNANTDTSDQSQIGPDLTVAEAYFYST